VRCRGSTRTSFDRLDRPLQSSTTRAPERIGLLSHVRDRTRRSKSWPLSLPPLLSRHELSSVVANEHNRHRHAHGVYVTGYREWQWRISKSANIIFRENLVNYNLATLEFYSQSCNKYFSAFASGKFAEV